MNNEDDVDESINQEMEENTKIKSEYKKNKMKDLGSEKMKKNQKEEKK
jgi:hypothetical protein